MSCAEPPCLSIYIRQHKLECAQDFPLSQHLQSPVNLISESTCYQDQETLATFKHTYFQLALSDNASASASLDFYSAIQTVIWFYLKNRQNCKCIPSPQLSIVQPYHQQFHQAFLYTSAVSITKLIALHRSETRQDYSKHLQQGGCVSLQSHLNDHSTVMAWPCN